MLKLSMYVFVGLLLFIGFFGLRACTGTDKDGASKLLLQENYWDIEITGYRWFSCSKDDWFHTGFKATKDGKEITGTVCEGLLFKGKTIRFD